MLVIKLDSTEELEAGEFELEHSLVSLSKWESIHCKAFFGKDDKTIEESKSYIRQMVVGPRPPENFEDRLTDEHIMLIHSYINSAQSATWFREDASAKSTPEAITTELIYYWLIQFQIPFEVQTWHFARLMNLIKISGIKQTKPKKQSRQQMAQEMRELNAKRREQLGTSG